MRSGIASRCRPAGMSCPTAQPKRRHPGEHEIAMRYHLSDGSQRPAATVTRAPQLCTPPAGGNAPAAGVTTSGPYAPLRMAHTGNVVNTWTCRREGNAPPNSEESGMEIKTWGIRAASVVGAVALLSVLAAPTAPAHESFKER